MKDPNASPIVVGAILAGGLSRRMGGGDKGLRLLAGVPILARIAERAAPQVDKLLLNANGPAGRFAFLDLPVVPDGLPDNPGPLAGLLAVFDRFAGQWPETAWIATFPADAPFFPDDLVKRLREAAETAGADASCAVSAGRLHPLFGLWRPTLADDLRRALLTDGLRRAGLWAERAGAVRVEFPATTYDPFFNVNNPDDLVAAERLLPSIGL